MGDRPTAQVGLSMGACDMHRGGGGGRERHLLPLLPDAPQRAGGALEALALAPQEEDHLILQHGISATAV